MGCHNGGLLSSYSGLINSQSGDFRAVNSSANTPMVVPGNASGSYLYQKITGTASAGSPMNASPAAVTAVETWINDGANP